MRSPKLVSVSKLNWFWAANFGRGEVKYYDRRLISAKQKDCISIVSVMYIKNNCIKHGPKLQNNPL